MFVKGAPGRSYATHRRRILCFPQTQGPQRAVASCMAINQNASYFWMSIKWFHLNDITSEQVFELYIDGMGPLTHIDGFQTMIQIWMTWQFWHRRSFVRSKTLCECTEELGWGLDVIKFHVYTSYKSWYVPSLSFQIYRFVGYSCVESEILTLILNYFNP